MNCHDVKMMIEEGEGFTLEFKRRISSAEKIARTIISLANTKGGIIYRSAGSSGARNCSI
jgi:predicted HTH transcriptional regulator